MNTQLTEIMRLITNLIRTGIITEVDRENWLCRVKVGELETNWISWLTLRAGGARTWWCPSPGEQVLLLSMGGHLETAFALPAIYSESSPPPADSDDGCITLFPDGARFEYEPLTGRLLITGVRQVSIDASAAVALDAQQLSITADRTLINGGLVINGPVMQAGGPMSSNGVVVDQHLHSGVRSGNDMSGGPQ